MAKNEPDPNEMLAGVPHGTEVTSPEGRKELIVYERDATGKVVGWHKEEIGA